MAENIKLEYRVVISYAAGDGGTTAYFARGAEFFLDEHGIQWVKFTPTNGYNADREHMVRTDMQGFTVVRRG